MVATDNKLTAAGQSSAQAWLRHASMLVWMTDAQGIIRLLDGDTLDSLEIDPVLWLGRPLVELFAAYDVCPENLERALGGEHVRSLGKLKGRLLETRYSPLLDARGAVTGVHAVSVDVTDSRRLDQVLNTVANAVSAETGDNFFKTLILQLQSALDADYVFVGSLSEDQQFIHVNAACAGGEIIENFSYALATTPCADVVHGDLCSYPRDVYRAYPDDHLLQEMGVEGYCGAKLRNAKGGPLGVLSVLYKKPMTETPLVENLLRIFSNRAAVEMERQQSAQALQSSERMHKVLSECNQALVRSDQQDQQLQQICNILVEHGGYPFVWVGSAETAEVIPQFFAGNASDYLDNVDALDRGARRSGQCIREDSEWLVRDGSEAFDQLTDLPEGVRSLVALPLVRPENGVYSVLWVLAEQPDAFDSLELNLLRQLADDMAFGLSAQRIKQALHESESKFRLMAEASMVGVYMIQDGLFVYSNPYMAQAFGYSAEQLTDLSVADLVAPSDLDKVLENLRRRNTGEIQSLGYDFTGLRADGETIQVEVFGSATVFNGKPCVVGTLIDVTDRQLLEQRLLLMERAIESSNNGIAISDLQQHDNPYIYVNPAFEQITGYQSEEILGRNGRVLLNGDTDQLAVDKLKQALHGKQSVEVVLRNYKRNGDMFWNDLSMAPVRDGEADATHFISIINDISESKQYEQQLEQLSYYDSLTGLANKNLLRDRLQQSIIQSSRNGRYSALLLLDLDRFKMLNQSLGYSATDEVLKSVARRIAKTVRQGDTVARLGADDFAVVLHDLRDVADVVALTQQLMSAVSKPLDSGPEGMTLTCSIGIAVYPQDGRDGEALRRNAEAAQFKAMEDHNTFRFYTPEYNDRAQDRLTMEMELGRALERQEFVLHYQPKVDLTNGTINGAEALIRWQHPERGLVPPTEFIPLAEDTGLITQIGTWAMQQACETIQQINQRCGLSLQIAVNLSAKQFSDTQLPQTISRTLRASGLEPELLECELTESMLMDDPDGALDIMRRLKSIGVGVALDDFGTGYSSLSYLKRFPIDTLKIDRSFVQDIPDDAQDMAIARAIIALAETLDLYVVAEGVETQEQQDFLRHERCNSMQGYLFSRPLPEEEFEALLLEKLHQ